MHRTLRPIESNGSESSQGQTYDLTSQWDGCSVIGEGIPDSHKSLVGEGDGGVPIL